MISKTSIGIETKNSFAQTAKNRQLRVPVSSLELGLFVSELDRPWIETRFLLQGFLLENEADLESLRIYCNHVYVDLRLSDEKVAVQWQATVAPSLEQVDSAQDASDKERVLIDEPELPTDSDPTPVRSDFARESGDEQLETNARTLSTRQPSRTCAPAEHGAIRRVTIRRSAMGRGCALSSSYGQLRSTSSKMHGLFLTGCRTGSIAS